MFNKIFGSSNNKDKDNKEDTSAKKFSFFPEANAKKANEAMAAFERIRTGTQQEKDVLPAVVGEAVFFRQYLNKHKDVDLIQQALIGSEGRVLEVTDSGDYGYYLLGSILPLEARIDAYLKSNKDKKEEPFSQTLSILQHCLQKIVVYANQVRPDRVRKLTEAVEAFLNVDLPSNVSHDALIKKIYPALYVTLSTILETLNQAKTFPAANAFLSVMGIDVDKIFNLIEGDKEKMDKHDVSMLEKIALKDAALKERMSLKTDEAENHVTKPSGV